MSGFIRKYSILSQLDELGNELKYTNSIGSSDVIKLKNSSLGDERSIKFGSTPQVLDYIVI